MEGMDEATGIVLTEQQMESRSDEVIEMAELKFNMIIP